MSQLALSLCLAFILIAFRQDEKERKRTSHALWIPFIWLAVVASKPIHYWINPRPASVAISELDYIQGNPIERTYLAIILCVGLIVLFKRREKLANNFRDNFIVYLFYIFALISVGWSNYQGASIRRWIKATGDVIMVLLVLTEDDQVEAVDRLLRRAAILLMPVSLVLIRWFGDLGISYTKAGARMWAGVTWHKNSLGLLCAFLGLFLTWRLIRGWRKAKADVMILDGFLLLLALYLLRGAQSATCFVVYFIGSVVLILGIYFKGNPRKLSSLLIVGAFVFLILQGVLVIFDTSISSLFFSVTARDASFTGRLPLWLKLIEIGSQRPILGAGYGSVWFTDINLSRAMFNDSSMFNAHNGYISVFMDIGIVGLSLALLMIVQSYRKVLKSIEDQFETGTLLLAFLFMFVFHNMTETSLARGATFLWFIFLLSSMVVINRIEVLDAQGVQPRS